MFSLKIYNMKTKYISEFEVIDSEEKSYFLGLFYSDGCMTKNKKITISLRNYDVDLLYKIQEYFPFFKIKERANKMFELYTFSSKFYKDLLAVGCQPRKSFENKDKIEFNIPEHLIHHFIRGYFDGDGSIYKANHRNLYFFDIVSVSKKTIIYFNNIFNKNNITLTYREKGKDLKNRVIQNRYLIECHNSSEMFKIKNYLYKDATIYLQRKFDLFQKVIPLKPSRNTNVTDVGDRGLKCPYCQGYFIILNGKRTMQKGIAYRFICNTCKKRYTNYTAPSCGDARRVPIQLDN